MKIALDYDGTFTEDRGFWMDFIGRAQDRNHTVYIVTFRSADLDKIPEEDEIKAWMNVETIYTDRTPKRKFCSDRGIQIDVWIDDQPDLIVNESDWSEQDLQDWRNSREG